MAPQMETTMVLRVDLECYRCYTKVKRTLCSIPQIRDQIYNEKQNTVTIRVVCCSPDKLRDKLLSKAGKAIKDILIQIAESPRPEKPGSNPDKPGSKPDKPPSKPDNPESKPDKPREGPPAAAEANEKPAAEKITKKVTFEPQGDEPVSAEGPKKQEAAAMVYMQPPQLIQHYPGYPVNAGCLACYEGRMCYHCHGVPGGLGGYYGVPPPPPPGGYGYGYGYGYRPYSDYVSDENATGCVVM